MWQDAPGASVVPWQSCTPPNTPAPPPAPLITTGKLSLFVIVTVCCGLVLPSGTSPKSSAVGLIRNRLVALPLNVKLNAWPFQLPEVVPVTAPVVVGVNA